MNNRFYKPLARVALIFTLTLLALSSARQAAAETRKILVVPFSIHADKDLAFLRKGITAMLSSRLTDVGKVVVMDQTAAADIVRDLPVPLTRETAAEAGRKAGADYVAFGSLTVFGESISTDARFVEADTSTLLVTFNETGQSQGDVIGHINAFAGEVNARVFGRAADGSVSAALAPAATSNTPTDDPDQANPAKKIWSGDGGMRIQAADPDADEADAKLWRSRRFPLNVEGLGLGDVDGDGDTEVVFVSENQMAVYRYKDQAFLKVAETELAPRLVAIGLDVADINGNGRAEIFITSRSENYFPHSYVLEWDGATFQTIYDAPNWYFRVGWNPQTKKRTLYGQKGGAREVVVEPVYVLGWVNGSYEPQDKILLPDGASVFGFAQGDLTGDGVDNTMAFTKGDQLQLSSLGRQEEWISVDPYGGKYTWLMTHEEFKEGQIMSRSRIGDPLPDTLFFVPQRVLLTDFDRDGRNEVLVVKNEDSTRGLMSRIRSYREGRFENLAWDNVGMRAVWRTRKFSGYISDYNLGDFDNDGQDEIVFAVVKRIGDPMTGEAKSYLVSWDPYQQKDEVPTQ
ncbi:MAG: FG-GAP-like repeat-containing protein [Desulfobacteraceae bacterium]|jgi:TolB-like protein|nr:FG-GAP-like repeat-containing protein [Desulfobacteraceae bacterium]